MNVARFGQMAEADTNEVYTWGNDLNNDFVRLNQNYQDYIRDFNSVKAEEMMHTKQFLVFKDRLVEYLRNFIKGLQRNVGVIEETLRMMQSDMVEQVLEKVVAYELSIPRMDVEVKRELIEEKIRGRYQSIYDWFVAKDAENEAGKLFDATNDIIRRITRYAAQLSEKNSFGANRREEYRKVAQIFLQCEDIRQAHCLSAMVFGLERPYHMKGDLVRETDSMNQGVYEEAPLKLKLKPRVRTYREKSLRSGIRENTEEKQRVRKQMIEQQKEDMSKIRALETDGKIDFASLPVIEPRMREILLRWLSAAMENPEYRGRTEEGRSFRLDMSHQKECCVVRCEDGNFTMPKLTIVFQEEKDAQEQFILSQLTEYIASNMPGGAVDWTVYTNRRRMIKVLRFAVAQGILLVTDGSDDAFMDNAEGEVLYENTGASRYFVKNFSRDISEYGKPEGFFAKNYHGRQAVRISAEQFSQALAQSRFVGVDPESLLEAYFERSLLNKSEEQNIWNRQREKIMKRLQRKYQGTQAQRMLPDVAELAKLKKIKSHREWEQQLLLSAEIINHLPYRKNELVYLAVFATQITGNPHAFDYNRDHGQLLCQLVTLELQKRCVEVEASDIFPALQRQQSFQKVGILLNDVSNYALLYGVTAFKLNGKIHEGTNKRGLTPLKKYKLF